MQEHPGRKAPEQGSSAEWMHRTVLTLVPSTVLRRFGKSDWRKHVPRRSNLANHIPEVVADISESVNLQHVAAPKRLNLSPLCIPSSEVIVVEIVKRLLHMRRPSFPVRSILVTHNILLRVSLDQIAKCYPHQ